jgi:hypothetical protein
MASGKLTLSQLQELEDVPARPAPETVEEPLVAIDMERWRLLTVERAEALVGCPRLFQRHIVLNHDDDVGVLLQVVDELLGEQGHTKFKVQSAKCKVSAR